MFSRILFVCFLLFATSASAKDYLIAFSGANGAIDITALSRIADAKKLTLFRLGWNNEETALKVISQLANSKSSYELYGYARGAQSVSDVMKSIQEQNLPKPKGILTIAAHNEVDVDFKKYGVPFQNYFGQSGKDNPGPGVHLPPIQPWRMQRYVVETYLNPYNKN